MTGVGFSEWEPRDGEIILFCAHADVSEDHIDISAKACPAQPFHWYFLGDDQYAKRRKDGETFKARLLCICNNCQKRVSAKGAKPESMAAKDAPWIGGPVGITRTL